MPRLSGAPVDRRVQIAAGLQAALLLGRGDARGTGPAMLSMEGAARSFWAAAFCLPAFLIIRLATIENLTAQRFLAELVGYVLGWVVFPLAALPLVEASGRGALYPGFVAAWNWSNVAQYAVLLGTALVGGILPAPFGDALALAAFGYALWLEWFVVRVALRMTGPQAAGFVVLDVLTGIVIALLTARIGG